nr:hypothetical protein [Tsukamurella sp. PLM1]
MAETGRCVPSRRATGRRDGAPAAERGGFGSRVEFGEEAFQVRTVTGSGAVKAYRCPGCDQVIGAGTAHVVVWPAAERGGVGERRHWHSGCWRREADRRAR